MFTAVLDKYGDMGEKTGWTYFTIPARIAEKLMPGVKKSFRVKGKIDAHAIKQVSLLPIGGGDFIMPVNATMRKAIRKKKGDKIELMLEADKEEIKINAELLECLADEPAALKQFNSMPLSHRKYYSKWIETAKTEATRTKRIALAVSSLAKKMDYGEMLRSQRDNN
ncbi:MAG: YdeI/OmpD-associated family protein [Ferruginibacter sp.]